MHTRYMLVGYFHGGFCSAHGMCCVRSKKDVKYHQLWGTESHDLSISEVLAMALISTLSPKHNS